jgi:hypothetical protein
VILLWGVVGLRILFETIKAGKAQPGDSRVAVAMVPEMRISMDRSNDKAKTSEKNANMSGRPIWLANSVLGNQCHVCAFFSNRDEEYQVLIPFENDDTV